MAPALLPPISVHEAQARLFALAAPVGIETVPLHDAVGRWAAADIVALRTQPATDLSAMDGYAVRFDDFCSRILGLSGLQIFCHVLLA